ncbi:MAG: glycoside hydrolase, family 3 domain protein [Pseudonocardiales bacterium]|nr:glycoside hydrolase, family 3 domain protein [Pseudonocardiales bacterium]
MNEDALRRDALGALLLGFHGSTVPGWLADALQAGLGGVVLFGSNLGDGSRVGELCGALRAAAGRDVVIALDEEGGDVTRLETSRGSSSPGAAALGFLDDPAATEQVYDAVGARLAAVGVTANLAPVADVNSDPRNPVIGVRSFGADPALVARHVTAAVRGIQRNGVAACVKHFPGHGDTNADSHHGVATITRSRHELDARELVPFRAAIDGGVRCVMTGHLAVPALDSTLTTVSPVITSDLLRTSLGFDGVVMTDALEMRALSDQMGLAEGVVCSLAAGADAIETGAGQYPDLVSAVPDAVVRAVRDGRLAASRVGSAAAATARLVTTASVEGTSGGGTSDGGTSGGGTSVDGAMAARCLEVIGTLPVLTQPLIVECRTPNGMATGSLEWSFARQLSSLCGGEVVKCADDPSALAAAGRLHGAVGGVVVVVRDPVRNPWQRRILEGLAAVPDAVVVDVGWPADLDGLIAEGVAVVRTRGIAPGLLAAAAHRIGVRA